MCGGLILRDEIIKQIAHGCKKSPAQVILRWHHEKGHHIFPKSTTPTRIKENIEIFDFTLSREQVASIDALSKMNMRIGSNPDIKCIDYVVLKQDHTHMEFEFDSIAKSAKNHQHVRRVIWE